MKTNYAIRGKHLLCLDGLRGVAILLVLLSHCYGMFPQLHTGWVGVDLFFVLSGFLITGILFETINSNDYFKAFYRRRFLRILPLYILVVGGLFFYVNFFLNSSEQFGFRFYTNNSASYMFFMQNWAQMQGDVFERCHLAHLWSLAIEEQFYFIWPLVIFIAKDAKRIVAIGAAFIVVAICLRIGLYLNNPAQEHPHTYWNTFCRMDSLVIGALAYFFINSKYLKIFRKHLKIFTIVLGIFLLMVQLGFDAINVNSKFMVLGGFTLLALFFVGVLILLVTTNSNAIVVRLFQNKFLQFTGKVSYGLYIFHWLIYVQINTGLTQLISKYVNGNLAQFLSSTIVILLSYGVSYISFNYFEKVFMQFRNGFAVKEIQLPLFGKIVVGKKLAA